VGCHVYSIGRNALVLKFDPWESGISSFIYSKSIGGIGENDEGNGITIDTNGYIYITGFANTDPPGFPITPDAYQTTRTGYEAFLVQLDPGGNVKYATYLGGYSYESGEDVTLGKDGSVYVIGNTTSYDFPRTWGSKRGYESVFVTKFSTGIQDESVYDSGNGGLCSAYGYTQKYGADPINTRTGGYDQSIVDLSVPTIAGPLELQRWYSSQATDIYSTTLGFGWTYNLDARLIFPDDPGGKAGTAQFKSQSSNIYFFYIDGVYADLYSGTFTPYPGLCGELISLKDSGGSLIGYLLTDSAQQTFTFNTDGLLLNWKDAPGHTISFVHTHQGGLTRLRHVNGPNGEFINLYYDDRKNKMLLTRAEAGIGDNINRVSYLYTNNKLTGVVDVFGHTWQYQYEDPINPHLLTKVIDPNNVIVEAIVYDSQGRAIEQDNGENELVMGLVYTGTNTTMVYDASLIPTRHSYDHRSTVTDIEDSMGGITLREYDINFRPTSITDPLGNTTSLNWSADGNNLIQSVQMLDSGESIINTMEYDYLNNLTQITDAEGYTATFNYSGTLMISNTDALGNRTLYTYTTSADGVPSGLLKTVQDPLGNQTSYGYYQNGNIHTITDAANNVTTYTYDDFGQLQSNTNESTGRVDWTCHDAAGRVWRTIGNLSSNPPTDPCSAQFAPGTDPESDQMHDTIYDARGNVIASIEWAIVDSQVVSYTTRTYYDDAGRVTDVVQNLRGQLIGDSNPPNYNQAFPDQNIKNSTVYNDDSTVRETIDNAGNITYYCYDLLNRVVKTIDNPTVPDPCEPYTPDPQDPTDQDVINETAYNAAGNVIATIDPNKRVTRTYYDSLNRPIAVVQNLTGNIEDPPPDWDPNYPDQNVRTDTIYDNNSNILRTIDNAGHITHNCYDRANQLTKTVVNLSNQYADPCDPSFVLRADADKDITTSTVYDGKGNAIETIDPLGIVSRTFYDTLNRPYLVVHNFIGSIQDPPPQCNRDTTGEVDPINICLETKYDDAGNAIASIDPLGRVTRTYYDNLNRPVLVIRNLTSQGYENPNQPNPSTFGNDENVASETFYDERGRTIAIKEYWVEDGQLMDRVTRTYYDDLGRQTTVVRNLIGQDIGNPEPPNIVEPSQNIRVDTTYNAQGDVVISTEYLTYADGQSFVRINRTYYDRLGRSAIIVRNIQQDWDLLSPDHPDCNRDTTGDEWLNNICSETTYDRNGNAIAVSEPLGYLTRTYYDGLNRPVTVEENLTVGIYDPIPDRNPDPPDQNVRTDIFYDQAGNRSSVIDPNGVTTAYQYDGISRLIIVVENYQEGQPQTVEVNVRTEYTYDKLGDQLTIRDANSTLNDTQDYTVFGYDDLGRQVSETDPIENTWFYFYDVNGSKVKLVDANSDSTSYLSDGLDRLVEIDYPAPDAPAFYTYNALGWRQVMTDSVGTTYWLYDKLGRITSVIDPFDEINYSYDASGNRTNMIYPDQKSVNYTYDELGRLSETEDWNNQVTTNKYDVAGNTVSVEYPNGITSSYTYNGMQRLESLVNSETNGTISYYEYTYDPVGNRLSQTERVWQPGEPLDMIFADGFESGDFSPWSVYSKNNDLTVDTSASIVDTYEMEVNINDGDLLWVMDYSPDDETHYFARFYFDPNSIRMSSGDVHQIFRGEPETSPGIADIFKVQFRKYGTLYYIDAYICDNDGHWKKPISAYISDTAHAIEIEWKASTAGESDGYLKLWLDDNLIGTVNNVNNDALRLGEIRMGVVSTPNVGTRGWYCFDSFASRNEGNLGKVEGAHGCGEIYQIEESILDLNSVIPMTVTLPYSGELSITETIPITSIFPIDNETVVLTATIPHTDGVSMTDTQSITSGLAILSDKIVFSDTTPIELNQAILTVTLPVTESLMMDGGWSMVITDTVEITVTGVLSNAAILPVVDFYPFTILPVEEEMQVNTDWSQEIVINYAYDPLNRLRQAEYSDDRQFDYDYDSVGNIITRTVELSPGNPITTTYQYDIANRLTNVNGQQYTWDNNGNLLNDDSGFYTYDHANRLTGVSSLGIAASYAYNGLGDRLQQTVNSVPESYTLDLVGGLTQVLTEGTHTYLYGNGRIAQYTETTPEYFLGDALGSARQLVDASGNVVLAKEYGPYGEVLDSTGSGSSSYGYTGEWTDSTGLVYLRARYYDPTVGRFMTRDTWGGDKNVPMSYNGWLYGDGNPIRKTDPTGHEPKPTDYDETLPPAGIRFFPAGGIPHALIYKDWDPYGGQFIPPSPSRVRPGTYGSQLYIKNGWTMLCGQVAIAAILRLTNPYMTANEVAYTSKWYFGGEELLRTGGGTGSSQLADFINSRYGWSWRVNYQGPYWTDYTYPDNRWQKLPYYIRGWLSSSKYPIVSVEITCGGKSKDCGRIGKGSNLIQHWVVITGVSDNWEWEWFENPEKHWIRIYNPFDNHTEYYTYEDIKWGMGANTGGGMMLLMERIGPHILKPPRIRCE
jgi:RHS repeat-associated protein